MSTQAQQTLAITGWSAVSPIGIGPDTFTESFNTGARGNTDVTEMFDDEPLPRSDAFAMPDFKAKDHLGRKGTSFLDRSTALAMVACGGALADAELVIDEDNAERVGVALGTTAGSVKSTSDYGRATFVEDKPYLVNPLIFPNAVMNCAAGQSAIRYRLKGVNATLAGGPAAMLSGLRYARTQIGLDRVETLVVGATEEFGPQTAWANEFAMRAGGGELSAGEGAAMFVVEDAARVRDQGRVPDAEVLAVEVATHVPDTESDLSPDFSASLARCIDRALTRAGITPDEVSTVASAENTMPATDRYEDSAITSTVGTAAHRIRVKQQLGEAMSASGALQLAALLAGHRSGESRDGEVSLLTAHTPDGVVGAAVLRGWRGRARASE
ncbi:beta-ketoacyl synthase N-terminal-like domain-containing protein [Prauserella halophila]|uniref:Beta-ketoacyl synthase N-terminal-like domain-containing protein n=1 Tax=Prauserella halophila TaxID=185641 RepID=A0ABN1W048_9PSEU|nr:beta-ketoacyl synthase N-terminal-like domain-containing protein [Prauserella halophila]MCP2235316.1 3-oxoacyl-[acyl-carrier-protein] synthase II [Prauserella halophila]